MNRFLTEWHLNQGDVPDAPKSVKLLTYGEVAEIIRNRQDYEEHSRYIYENPIRRCYDELYLEDE